MESALREKMTQLTNKCEVLQKNGKFTECIDIMEEIASIKKTLFGLDHPEFLKASEKLCEYLNLSAMLHLHKENFELTLDQLKKAELAACESIVMRSTTYNNLACYYRRTGKARTALSYLVKSLELELKQEQPKTLADTHLNLCAVLSQLERHDDALQHGLLAIVLLQDEFLTPLLRVRRTTLEHANNDMAHAHMQPEFDYGTVNDQRLAVLAIAYHNLGVEFEHLKRYEQALKIYRRALNFAKQNLPQNQQLVRNLAKVVQSASQQIKQARKSGIDSINSPMAYDPSNVNQTKNYEAAQRSLNEAKDVMYRELGRKAEKYKGLPKLVNNGNGYDQNPKARNNNPNTTQYGSMQPRRSLHSHQLNESSTLEVHEDSRYRHESQAEKRSHRKDSINKSKALTHQTKGDSLDPKQSLQYERSKGLRSNQYQDTIELDRGSINQAIITYGSKFSKQAQSARPQLTFRPDESDSQQNGTQQ